MGQRAGLDGMTSVAIADDPKQLLLDAIRISQGHGSKAAWLLGMRRIWFYRQLEKHGLKEEMQRIRREAKRRDNENFPASSVRKLG